MVLYDRAAVIFQLLKKKKIACSEPDGLGLWCKSVLAMICSAITVSNMHTPSLNNNNKNNNTIKDFQFLNCK